MFGDNSGDEQRKRALEEQRKKAEERRVAAKKNLERELEARRQRDIEKKKEQKKREEFDKKRKAVQENVDEQMRELMGDSREGAASASAPKKQLPRLKRFGLPGGDFQASPNNEKLLPQPSRGGPGSMNQPGAAHQADRHSNSKAPQVPQIRLKRPF
ncbi:MAG: hypothetical protein KDD64_13730 [Bdellovibrionales bacterium]|nr:hypothetical protein [Bdellovibrionales bacterium]